MSLELLLIIAFSGAFITYLLGKLKRSPINRTATLLRDYFAVFISCVLVAVIACLYGKSSQQTYYPGFLGIPLILRLNMLSWFFAIAISSLGALSTIFSLSYMKDRKRTDFYYLMFLLVNAAMLGIVFSGDLVSFFIFWEIMSWLAMLIGIMSIYANFGSLTISELPTHLASASHGSILFVLILFIVAFGIKNAIWPFHIWLPPAHSEAPSPFSAVLSGTLIKMGTYGFLLLIYVIIGLKTFFGLGQGLLSFYHILCILGAITILIPTFIAVGQNDAKRLLAWSTIGQAGYIILGIAFGTSLSVTSGIFHFFNHTIFKALLFMIVGAVEYRTRGVRDMNSLGGLIKKMPVTFIAALVGICGLIGVPLTNGFVSKWLIYKTLILKGSPFLAFAALLGTWGTILYSYKLIHNMFLGQLPEKYKDLKKAPFSMQLPMIMLSFAILLFGIFPGIPLKVINNIVTSFGLETLNVTLWGIASDTGALNIINIFAAILIASTIVWLIFRAGPKTVPVAQDDNYAAGASVPDEKYHYTVNFYNPLYRMITPYLRDFADEFYMKLTGWTRDLCNGVRRLYTGDVGNYVMYIVLFAALLIFTQLTWGIW